MKPNKMLMTCKKCGRVKPHRAMGICDSCMKYIKRRYIDNIN